ncbi:MAG: hypothetical protein Q7S84_04490 [bacterium]|nr:hypothetical protein [bacterium]
MKIMVNIREIQALSECRRNEIFEAEKRLEQEQRRQQRENQVEKAERLIAGLPGLIRAAAEKGCSSLVVAELARDEFEFCGYCESRHRSPVSGITPHQAKKYFSIFPRRVIAWLAQNDFRAFVDQREFDSRGFRHTAHALLVQW